MTSKHPPFTHHPGQAHHDQLQRSTRAPPDRGAWRLADGIWDPRLHPKMAKQRQQRAGGCAVSSQGTTYTWHLEVAVQQLEVEVLTTAVKYLSRVSGAHVLDSW